MLAEIASEGDMRQVGIAMADIVECCKQRAISCKLMLQAVVQAWLRHLVHSVR